MHVIHFDNITMATLSDIYCSYFIRGGGGWWFILETNGKKTVKNDVIVLALHHHMDELAFF